MQFTSFPLQIYTLTIIFVICCTDCINLMLFFFVCIHKHTCTSNIVQRDAKIFKILRKLKTGYDISERDLISSSSHVIYFSLSLFYMFYAYIMNTFQFFII